MKEYKFVSLNPKSNWTREKDLLQAEETLNQCVMEGWTFEQLISPADLGGAIVALFSKEK